MYANILKLIFFYVRAGIEKYPVKYKKRDVLL
jgi:hypothetical protein